LAQKGNLYLDLFRKSQSRAAGLALEGTEVVMPHFVYEGPHVEIDLGGRIVELRNWGMVHTRGDQVAWLPKERILFAGDLIKERMFPIFPWFPPNDTDVDAVRWISVLNDFRRLGPSLIIPGHGDPGTIDIALDLASQMEAVGRRVRALRATGKTAEAVIREAKPEIIAANPTWEHAGLIDWEINYSRLCCMDCDGVA